MSIPGLTDKENAPEEAEAAMSPPHSEKPQGDVQSSPATVMDDKPSDGVLDGSPAETLQESPRRVFTKKVCGVCNEKESKYKCTRCFLPYCSIACSTVHKANHPAMEPKPAAELKAEPESKSAGTAPQPGTVGAAGFKGPFAALDDSKELLLLFQLYPSLPALLDKIDTATLPPLNDPNSNAGNGYKRGARRQKQEPWNHDRGVENGLKALLAARELDGKDGEGIREYSRLVLQILSGDDDMDAATLIQKQLAEENARIVETLLNSDIR